MINRLGGATRIMGVAMFVVGGCGNHDIPPDPLLLERPFRLEVPPGRDPSVPAPLLILLHGFTFDSTWVDGYFALREPALARGFLVAIPDGTESSAGLRFWNATDGCCNQKDDKVDDVAYLRAIIRDTRVRHGIDPKRVFLVGHSNGAFM